MAWRSLLAVMGFAIAAVAPAADLAKIDRKIAKEPAYESKDVRYCLIVFGPEAKCKVWLVQDGDMLYVDTNGNGDLTEPAKKFPIKQKEKTYRSFEAGKINDGSLTHTDLSVTQMLVDADFVGNEKELARLKGVGTEAWNWWVRIVAERPAEDSRRLPKKISYVINGDGDGYLMFGRRPQDAPVIHLNGPWTLALQDIKQHLTVGRSSKLQIGVGSVGIGPGTFSWVEYPKTIPTDVYPQVEATFAPAKPGAKQVTQTYTLKDRC
jgi:hypothetical protein